MKGMVKKVNQRFAGVWILVGIMGMAGMVGAAETKLEGVLMGGYQAYVSDFRTDGTAANNFNAFMIQRIYLGANTKYSDRLSSKIVLEANSLTAGNAVFLKLAYVEWKGLADGLTIAAGLPGTPWRAFEENLWKYRFVEKIQEDLEGILKPSDEGLKATYVLSGALGTVEAMLSNGEGFATPEVSRDKDIQARWTVQPFGDTAKEFSVSVFGLYGKANTDRRRERVMALVAYDTSKFTVAGSVVTAWDQAVGGGGVTAAFGYSVYGSAGLADAWGILARVDSFDPDLGIAGNQRVRLIGGFSYDCGEGVKLAFTDHLVIQETESAARKNQHAIQVNATAKF